MRNYIIFDLDGTLLDSMNVWDTVGMDFLRDKGVIVPDDLRDILKTKSLKQSAVYMNKRFHLSLSTEEVMKEINDLVKHQYVNTVQLKPFALEYLQYLKRKNIRMCIATASDYHHTVAALKRLHIFDYFDFILTCTEVGFGKDNPTIFNLAAQKWGAEPNEVMVFEDALHAIETAKAAGFFTVGVFDQFAEKETEKIKQLSDVYIKEFKDLRDEK